MTSVANVKTVYLRPQGFWDLLEWLRDDSHVYIGRYVYNVEGADKSFWHNPYKAKKYGREKCLELYKEYVLNNPSMMKRIEELRGKTLGCWCHPEKCHGDVLIEILDELDQKKKEQEKKKKKSGLKSGKDIIL